MARISTLLDELERLAREREVLDRKITDLKQQIVDEKPVQSPRRSTRREKGLSEPVEQAVKALKDAGKPLNRHELAALLGIDGSAAGYRLAKAMKRGFVVKVSYGRYAVTDEVKAALQ